MSKLHDVKGYWDSSYTYDFNETNMWEGKILLEDDGWFEGIVVDPYSPYTKDRFIFGVYHPTKVIELFKFTPSDVSDPFVFHGTKSDNGYSGMFEIIGLFGAHPYGVSNIITQDTKENVETETEQLKSRIQNFKENILDEAGISFYDNSIAMRNSMCQIILRNYEGRGFSNEETQQIMEEVTPVNQRVMEATEEAAKRLVKKMPTHIFDGDDDDLPF